MFIKNINFSSFKTCFNFNHLKLLKPNFDKIYYNDNKSCRKDNSHPNEIDVLKNNCFQFVLLPPPPPSNSPFIENKGEYLFLQPSLARLVN